MHSPRLAVFVEKSSVSMMELAEAAHDGCRLGCVIGPRTGAEPGRSRALRWFGDVADITGMGLEAIVAFPGLGRPRRSSCSTMPPRRWQPPLPNGSVCRFTLRAPLRS
jgi:hypothetical protein